MCIRDSMRNLIAGEERMLHEHITDMRGGHQVSHTAGADHAADGAYAFAAEESQKLPCGSSAPTQQPP
eukprot:3833699-Karenia_brevis.AAC.1